MSDFTIDQLVLMSRLLDEALPLDEAGRRAWLEDLYPRYQDLTEALRQALLPSDDESSAIESLATLPKIGAVSEPRSSSTSGLQAGVRVGPYELIRQLGVGGMAEVWLARRADGAFKREVALKLPLTRLRADLEQRFAREREILATLNHPNIARLFDAGFAPDGQPYFALEYVDGTPITTHCDAHRLPIRARLELFRQVLSAVLYAHANLVIHRDLKPSNILVTADGQARLLDFGIAKLLIEGEAKETELTRLSGRAMTLDYAAPEQIAGAPITTAADVYALGVMLFELLTGVRPYRLKRDSRGALEEAILQVEPVAPSRINLSEAAALSRATSVGKLVSALKGDLDTIAFKALKKSPSERYATADAFAEDIARFLRGDVVLAQRDTFAYRAVKFTRRHWVAISTASVLMLTLAGGLAATSYEAKVASAQRDAALQAQLRSLTQTAAARLRDADVAGALSIILEVLPHRGVNRAYTPEALSVFQEARAADRQVFAITANTARLWSAVFSPDGSRVVSASSDNTARLWDSTTGRPIIALIGHANRVWSASFSPDGTHVVTASSDKTARIWDSATGRPIIALIGHTDRVWFASFSPDGTRVVTASGDHTARIWDAATGKEIVLLSGHTDWVHSAGFSPDGKRIVTASFDKTARIWDAVTGRQLILLNGHEDRLETAAFSPDGKRVVTASADKSARIWDAATGQQVVLLNGHTDHLTTAAFSPDGERIVTASLDQSVRLWDAATGRETMLLSGHRDVVRSAAFSPDGRRIVTTSDDKTMRFWDAAMDRELVLLSGHTGALNGAAFSPDGSRVLTASTDKTARIWNAATGRPTLVLSGHTGEVISPAFSPDGRRVVTASIDLTARIWDAATGQEIMLLKHPATVEAAAFSPDGQRIVTACFDATARIWNAVTGQQILQMRGHTDRVEGAAFSPDGTRIVTASADKSARVWDAATGRQVLLLSGHEAMVNTAAFSPDGRRIVTASIDKTARVWDAATGRQIELLSGHKKPVGTAAFTADGQHIVTAADDGTARIWDVATGQQIALLSGHTDQVNSAVFSPDGRRILTASVDKTARIWDALTPPLEAQITWAEAAQFDPMLSETRFQLGLPSPTDVHQWPVKASKCDESAAAPYDPDRHAPGFMLEQVAPDIAIAACANDENPSGDNVRTRYQHGRALAASGNFASARRDLEHALADGYGAARIDLGMLLSKPSAGSPDIARAISLYEQAWNHRVTMAAFELGSLYEHGVSRADNTGEYLLAPDQDRAWSWYRKAFDAGEPNALARFAERDDGMAFSEQNPEKKQSYLLESFKHYAAAAERARSEDWPDDAWRNWRYRRASLARLLAREGMMENVAGIYESVRKQNAP